jgi:hypothetical protein
MIHLSYFVILNVTRQESIPFQAHLFDVSLLLLIALIAPLCWLLHGGLYIYARPHFTQGLSVMDITWGSF